MVRHARNVLVAIFFLLVGCSAHGSAPGASVTSGPASAAAASTTSHPAAPTTPGQSATPSLAAPTTPGQSATAAPLPSGTYAPSRPGAAGALPVLGVGIGPTKGYGSVRPGMISNGGDPTGIVTGLSWKSWGEAEAVGSGMAYYDPPNVPVSRATREHTTVVAFDLGTCNGRYMYQAIEWYFPESGGSFKPGNYLNICSWTYHPPA